MIPVLNYLLDSFFDSLRRCFSIFFLVLTYSILNAQPPNPVKDIFPSGTTFIENIAYSKDANPKHLLDLYLPSSSKRVMPLVIWIHGGAWRANDKYADMGYMKNTIRLLINDGIAIASIDYRYSTEAVFPAQIQDCNEAIGFLYKYAAKYGYSKNNFFLMGFSAGGHLASLAGLSLNNHVKEFRGGGKISKFKIKGVIDCYGIIDLVSMPFSKERGNSEDFINTLLGGSVTEKPDVAKWASPSSYVDEGDPPFLIIHGEKDATVPVSQSEGLNSKLKKNHINTVLIIVKEAPHFGDMFDSHEIGIAIKKFINDLVR